MLKYNSHNCQENQIVTNIYNILYIYINWTNMKYFKILIACSKSIWEAKILIELQNWWVRIKKSAECQTGL